MAESGTMIGARPAALLLALGTASLATTGVMALQPGDAAPSFSVPVLEGRAFTAPQPGRTTIIMAYRYGYDPAQMFMLNNGWSLESFLWLAPKEGVDFLILPAVPAPVVAEALAKQLYNRFVHAMQDAGLPEDLKQLRLRQLNFGTTPASVAAPWLTQMLDTEWTAEGYSVTSSVQLQEGWWNNTAVRLDAWYDWVPRPPASAARRPRPRSRVTDEDHGGDLPEEEQRPEDAAGLGMAYVPNACVPVPAALDVKGRWVLTGNSSLCRYGDMARQVQAAGAAGLIVHANRHVPLEVMMPAGVDLDIPGSHGPSSTPAKHRATRPLRGAALAAAISAVPKPTAKASEQKTKQRPATWFWCDPQSGAVAAEVLRGRQACRVLEQLVVNGTSGAAAAGQGAQQCKQQLLAACVQETTAQAQLLQKLLGALQPAGNAHHTTAASQPQHLVVAAANKGAKPAGGTSSSQRKLLVASSSSSAAATARAGMSASRHTSTGAAPRQQPAVTADALAELVRRAADAGPLEGLLPRHTPSSSSATSSSSTPQELQEQQQVDVEDFLSWLHHVLLTRGSLADLADLEPCPYDDLCDPAVAAAADAADAVSPDLLYDVVGLGRDERADADDQHGDEYDIRPAARKERGGDDGGDAADQHGDEYDIRPASGAAQRSAAAEGGVDPLDAEDAARQHEEYKALYQSLRLAVVRQLVRELVRSRAVQQTEAGKAEEERAAQEAMVELVATQPFTFEQLLLAADAQLLEMLESDLALREQQQEQRHPAAKQPEQTKTQLAATAAPVAAARQGGSGDADDDVWEYLANALHSEAVAPDADADAVSTDDLVDLEAAAQEGRSDDGSTLDAFAQELGFASELEMLRRLGPEVASELALMRLDAIEDSDDDVWQLEDDARRDEAERDALYGLYDEMLDELLEGRSGDEEEGGDDGRKAAEVPYDADDAYDMFLKAGQMWKAAGDKVAARRRKDEGVAGKGVPVRLVPVAERRRRQQQRADGQQEAAAGVDQAWEQLTDEEEALVRELTGEAPVGGAKRRASVGDGEDDDSDITIPLTQIGFEDGVILRDQILLYGDKSADGVRVRFSVDQVPGGFAGIDSKGRLVEVGWLKVPTLMHLAWQAQYQVYLTELERALELEPPELELPIFEEQSLAGEHGATVEYTLPPVSELRPHRMLLDMRLSCQGARDVDCPQWDHVVQLFACCGGHCKACDITPWAAQRNGDGAPQCGFEMGRWITPFRRASGRWVTDITPLIPLLDPSECSFTMQAPPWAGNWVASLSLLLSRWDAAMPAVGQSMVSRFPLLPTATAAPHEGAASTAALPQEHPQEGPAFNRKLRGLVPATQAAAQPRRALASLPAQAQGALHAQQQLQQAALEQQADAAADGDVVETTVETHRVEQQVQTREHRSSRAVQLSDGRGGSVSAEHTVHSFFLQVSTWTVKQAMRVFGSAAELAGEEEEEEELEALDGDRLGAEGRRAGPVGSGKGLVRSALSGNLREVAPLTQLVPTHTVQLFEGANFNASYNDRALLHVKTPAGAVRAVLMAVVSGHGSDENNCAEFCPTSHVFTVNGVDRAVSFDAAGTAWGCTSAVPDGAVPNERGTWFYSRNGWCDGQQVAPWLVDVTDLVSHEGLASEVRYRGLYQGATPHPDAGSNAYIMLSSFITFYSDA